MKKTRFQKSWSTRNVPEDVWPEVLSRLPVKSLLRFRCVSRSWRALIDDPDFARSHLTRFNNNRLQSHLFFFVQGKGGVVKCSKTLRITARLWFRSSPGRSSDESDLKSWVVVSSIDGLFMLRNYGNLTGMFMLWNPSSGKTLILPPTPQVSIETRCVDLGIGFDPFLKDYKFVTFIQHYRTGLHLVAVYTLGTNSWKTIRFQGIWPQHLIFPRLLKSFCLRGVLYALASAHYRIRIRSRLFSFDLSSEVFSSTRLPVEDDPGLSFHSQSQNLTMINGGCSLALFDCLKTEGSIWVMENLTADFKSLIWTKRYAFSTTILQDETVLGSGKLLYLNKDCEMLLHWRFSNSRGSGMVSSYNLETGKEKIISRTGVLGPIITWPYIESLVLP